jgi:hypothetical protein
MTKDQVIGALGEGEDIYDKIPSEYYADRDFIMLALDVDNGSIIEYASEVIKDDEEIVRKALEFCPHAYHYASERIKSDKKFMLEALKIGADIDFLSDNLKGTLNSFQKHFNTMSQH